ncbi:MAG: DUF4406 domain-containing protein [Cyanobacteria bacterium J06633_2]
MLIYIAGPYRAGNGRTVEDNIRAAEKAAIAIWETGHYALCPHLNTAHFEGKAIGVSDEQYLAGTMEMLRRCDAVVMVENWEESGGAVKEYDYAKSVGMPVHYSPQLLADCLAGH